MGKLTCGVQCTRTILFLLNILFLISGFVLLGFGIYVNVSKKFDIAFSENINGKIVGGNAIQVIGIIIIVVASFTIILSALGCLGATFKNRCFLYFYAIILTLLVITEIGALIATFYYRHPIEDSYESGFRELFNEGYNNNKTDIKGVIEDIEREFKCCGISNFTDYSTRNFTIPTSCHIDQDNNKGLYSDGCAHAVITWICNQFPIIVGILAGILLLEIFGIISSIALGVAISHSSFDDI